jgi:ASC-1-like (ASCH) protein
LTKARFKYSLDFFHSFFSQSKKKMQLFCQEPYFTQIETGTKTIEGRCGIKYAGLKVGDLLTIVRLGDKRTLTKKVKRITRYLCCQEMLEKESLASLLPEVNTLAEGQCIYDGIYSEEKQREGTYALELC